ncbi:MAG: hydrolase, partial [Thermoplasmata archaeon]
MRIPTGTVELDADFTFASPGCGTVIFAHGSGSGRRSPRNRQVARALHDRGLGTLLLDLLAGPEARTDEVTAEFRFDIPLLTRRLLAATDWLLEGSDIQKGPIG